MNTLIQTAVRRMTAPLAFALLAGCAGMAMSDAKPAMVRDGVLTNAAGMTLYTFDKDPADASKSVCNGPCAVNWPPLAADGMAKADGDWAPVKRDDGTMQWAYKGKPVYLWIKDQKPGDRSGDGVNNVWRIAKP